MPFDPSEPKSGTPKRSAPIRENFVALKAMLDTIPAGPPGQDGRGIANIRFNPDNTLTIEMTDGATFGPFPLPVGPAGSPGADSTVPGPQGAAGNEGRGIAEVFDNGDGRAMVRMSDGATYGPFMVANGPSGAPGSNGNDGRGIFEIRNNGDGTVTVVYTDGNTAGPFPLPAGPQGPQGVPGEVSAADLSFAFGNTSANSNSVQSLDTPYADPEKEAMRQKINELISALRR